MRGGANEMLTLKGASVSEDGLTDRSIDLVLLSKAGSGIGLSKKNARKQLQKIKKKKPGENQTKQTKQTKPQSHVTIIYLWLGQHESRLLCPANHVEWGGRTWINGVYRHMMPPNEATRRLQEEMCKKA